MGGGSHFKYFYSLALLSSSVLHFNGCSGNRAADIDTRPSSTSSVKQELKLSSGTTQVSPTPPLPESSSSNLLDFTAEDFEKWLDSTPDSPVKASQRMTAILFWLLFSLVF